MPASTVIVVFGSWIVIAVLTLLYYRVWSHRHDWDDPEDPR